MPPPSPPPPLIPAPPPHRPRTLFTGQWADMPLETLSQKAKAWGYEGLELACWGGHFDVQRALREPSYCDAKRAQLASHGLRCWALSNHLVGQAVCDLIDERHRAILPAHVWGDGEPEGVRRRATQEMMDTARAAARMGVRVVNGFTGSSIWHLWYAFPPVSPARLEEGFADFARRWNPILDVFDQQGVRFALEVHPTEIAYDIVTARRALAAIGDRPAFGFNFDPSHLLWQGVDPAAFIDAFPDRIYHCHIKDCAVSDRGDASILSSHLAFGDARRGWDFRSPGRGSVRFEEVLRALNRAGYSGPLSVEWEDSGMDREHGAEEAARFVARLDFPSSAESFESAFARRAGPGAGPPAP